MKELISNADGRLSTTATIQFAGFVVLALTLVYSVALGNTDTPDLYLYFAGYCGGLTATKGAVTAYRHRQDVKKQIAKPLTVYWDSEMSDDGGEK